jgi:ferric iron reductase protein FhuF
MNDLRAVLDAVAGRVSYLTCATDAVAGEDGWMSCAELIADPDRLRREIDATALGRGTDDAQVLASLFAQSYAYRIPSIAIAAWALGLPSPSVAPEETLVRITRHRPGQVAVTTPLLHRHDTAAQLAAEVIDGHLVPFFAAVRSTTKIGMRLLLGNAAASIASLFRAVQSTGPHGDPAVHGRAAGFFAVPAMRDLGDWSAVEVADRLGWYFDRSTCCLWYRTTGGSMCDDCSLRDRGEQTQRRLAELTDASEGAAS